MQITFSLNVVAPQPESMLQVGTLSLFDGWQDLNGLALHRAIQAEVGGLLTDLKPYMIEAVYRALKAEAASA